MNSFPAILIGGPPHSGKSTLAYSLSQALRRRNIAHYLMRAAPDGEGDWTHELQNAAVQPVRFKGAWTQHWVDVTCRDVAQRTLPLLVDVGGKPTPAQQAIFDQCTHAIVIAANDHDRERWAQMAQAHNLMPIATLRSVLTPEPMADPCSLPAGPLMGNISGLSREAPAPGGLFDALVERVADLFAPFTEEEVLRIHLSRAPFRSATAGADTCHLIHFRDLHRALHPNNPSGRFILDNDIAPALALIPDDRPIALYGRAPIRLVAAIAAQRDVRWQFDARLGWVQTPRLAVCAPGDDAHRNQPELEIELVRTAPSAVTLIARAKDNYYLDYDALIRLRLPHIAPDQHVTIGGPQGGKLPQWLVTGIAAAYRACASLNAWQPQVAEPGR
ncbi:MAG: hypothetical protein ACUVSX_11320 [Aggregatilineales bacterium]